MGKIRCDVHGDSPIRFVCPHLVDDVGARPQVTAVAFLAGSLGHDLGDIGVHVCLDCEGMLRQRWPALVFPEEADRLVPWRPVCSACLAVAAPAPGVVPVVWEAWSLGDG